MFFDSFDRPEIAATVYGARQLPAAVDHLRSVLGASAFDERVATGAAMTLVDAVGYARLKLFCEDACSQFLTGESL